MSFFDLTLDVKTVIAQYHWKAYFNLYLVDEVFMNHVKKYGVKGHLGVFVEQLCVVENNIEKEIHYLGGKYVYRLWEDKTQCWIKEGKLHRDSDLPAIIWANGTQEWWKEGKRHRDDDLPALINADGTQEWWKEGKWHRDGDLSAVIWADDTKEWWKNGKKRRRRM